MRYKNMKTLILSCNTGEGHNSCSRAIKEYFDGLSEVCEVVDTLSFISDFVSNTISQGHDFIYQHLPKLFSGGYDFAEKHEEIFAKNSPVGLLLASCTPKLYAYIQENGFDTVISTHVFSAFILTDILQKYEPRLKTAYVSTDYTCSPSTKQSNLDYYFVPDESLVADFLSANIPNEKIVASGMPVRQAFYKRADKTAMKDKFGIDRHSKHLVIMCGSMGCGPLNPIVRLLSEQLPEGYEASVVCGKNAKLKEQLEKFSEKNPRIHALGYVTEMSALLDSADLYLTKPGGLSTSEATVKGLPMVFIDAVAGCEKYNMDFFLRKGCAKSAEEPAAIVGICLTLLANEEERRKMSLAVEKLHKGNAAQEIYQTLSKNV